MRGASQLVLGGGEDPAYMGRRPEDDFYKTERWLVDAVLEARALNWWHSRRLLDVGAGDGVLTEAVRDWMVDLPEPWTLSQKPGPLLPTMVELDPIRARSLERLGGEVVVENFLAWAPEQDCRWDVIVSNPPFGFWDDFVQAMLSLRARAAGHERPTVLVLGFVNVLGGQGRAAWWRADPPDVIWLSPRRVSFTADGQADPRDCAWFQWGGTTWMSHRPVLRWLATER